MPPDRTTSPSQQVQMVAQDQAARIIHLGDAGRLVDVNRATPPLIGSAPPCGPKAADPDLIHLDDSIPEKSC